ncbi:MAG: phosphatidylserine decarboxylase [Oscillospiraceae bacterium]
MDYIGLDGAVIHAATGQDKLLTRVFGSPVLRTLIKPLTAPVLSKAAGRLLDSKLSSLLARGFIRKNKIDMSDYEKRHFQSFNDFFTRKMLPGKRVIAGGADALVSPADGKVSCFRLTEDAAFTVKNSVYTAASLLRDKTLATRFSGGTAIVIRLSVDDYHRYCYCCDGIKTADRHIKGFLNTVHPRACEQTTVYKQNSRSYCVIRSVRFGALIQMEVGALLVGRICNNQPDAGIVNKGAEKGRFEFGGSTVILFLEKDACAVAPALFKNTAAGFETLVRQGNVLARTKHGEG